MTVQEWFTAGWQHHQADRYPQAEAAFRQVLQADPGHAAAWLLLAETCLLQDKFAEAERYYRQALSLQSNNAQAYANRGVALAELGKHAEAAASYRAALQLQPIYVDALSNLGAALTELDQLEESIRCLQQALALAPTSIRALNNLGKALLAQNKPVEAEASLRQAIRLHPGYAKAHKNLGMALLQQGNYEEGWPEYEWRWYCKELPPLPYPQPRWDGSPLAGCTILLCAEQGLGDTLQFIRYAPLVKERGGRVLVSCQRPLVSLLTRCPGIDAVLAQGDHLPSFDVYIPLLSLPTIFGTTVATVPAKIPYLFADRRRVESWSRELPVDSFKIGICWQGSPGHTSDRNRSTRLAYFEPLARVPGVRLVSLQVGAGTEQLQEVGDRFPVLDLGGRFDPASFEDAAAVVAGLDLVISVDSAIAHLAGGLGIPVWVLLPFAPDWRWLLGREDSPWYPSLRLSRQTAWGRWQPLFEHVAETLQPFPSRARRAAE